MRVTVLTTLLALTMLSPAAAAEPSEPIPEAVARGIADIFRNQVPGGDPIADVIEYVVDHVFPIGVGMVCVTAGIISNPANVNAVATVEDAVEGIVTYQRVTVPVAPTTSQAPESIGIKTLTVTVVVGQGQCGQGLENGDAPYAKVPTEGRPGANPYAWQDWLAA